MWDENIILRKFGLVDSILSLWSRIELLFKGVVFQFFQKLESLQKYVRKQFID